MSDNKWHRSNAVLSTLLAILTVLGGFSVFALDGPLRFVVGSR